MKRKQLQETIDFLKSNGIINPTIGIVLGTGLGKLVHEITIEKEIPYTEIPNFPQATVEFHSGKLVYGELSGKKVVVMAGRFHLYEGYSPWEVTYGIRTMQGLGIKNLLISNAAGAINLDYKKGDLMLIEDHINLQGSSPLAFNNAKEFGNIFVDLLEPYSQKLNLLLKQIAKTKNINLYEGVYASVLGPQLETRAEYRMLQILETDAVGMSTVPEVIVAKQLNIPCCAISVLTDECDPKNLQPVNIEEITMRLILGFIFFFQGYGKVFKFGLDGVYQNFFLKGYSELLPKFLLLFTAYYTSLIELIGGILLIIGFKRDYTLYALASVLIIVTFGHGLKDPIWNLSDVMYRAIFLVGLLLLPKDLDKYSVDFLIKRNK